MIFLVYKIINNRTYTAVWEHVLPSETMTNKAGFIFFDFINARTRAYAPHWATPRANIAPRRCVVNYKYEHTRVYACKLPWCLYPLVKRDPRKRIWLDEISTPALKVQLVWTLGRTYARIRAYTRAELYAGSMNGSTYARVCACIRAYTRARSMNPALAFDRMTNVFPRNIWNLLWGYSREWTWQKLFNR